MQRIPEIILPFERSEYTGCYGRPCPCRVWVGCSKYTDMKRQAERLKNKEYSFQEWYRDNFRLEIGMIDICVNG